MDERGLWKLFFKTGRPEIYLAIAARRREAEGERLALLLARQALNEGQSLRARVLMDLAPESSQKRLLYGESFLREKEYPQAAEQYLAAERLLEAVGGDPRVVYEPLEICFREMEDYKMAYFYAAKQK